MATAIICASFILASAINKDIVMLDFPIDFKALISFLMFISVVYDIVLLGKK